MKAALSAQINKTDRNDARGIAQMMRVGLFRPVHVKTERSQEIRMLLTARKSLQPTMIDAENNLRGLMHNSCLKVGAITRLQFEVRVIDLIKERRHLTVTIAPLLEVRRVLREQYQRMHKAMEQLATDDGICRLLMTAPGVVPLVSLTLRAGIDEAACFSQSRPVLAHFGLAPARYQSGELDRGRDISRCGDTGKMGAGRSGWHHHAPVDQQFAVEGQGHGPGQTLRSCKGRCCRGPTFCDYPAPDADRRYGILLAGAVRLSRRTRIRTSARTKVACRDRWAGNSERRLNEQ